MKSRSGQLYVPKVSGTSGHVSSASLALRDPVYDTLTGVHQPGNFGPAPFHGVWISDTIGDCYGHSFLGGVFRHKETVEREKDFLKCGVVIKI